ncbi:MAG: hypothetical protein IPN86_22640 [Saprospiraceae bacterium]|nr:hypothetical protein [Saprospiraceae bacterium]
MRRIIPYIILAAVLIGGLIAYNMYNKSHVETKDATSDIVISPKELLDAYELDEAAADAKYLDKIIEVKGTVKAINQVDKGGSLTLDTGNDMSSIICEFETVDAYANVKVGDQVTVKGFCSGKLMDIVLVRCSL